MKDYATIYDQLIAGNGTVQYLIRWDSYQTITYEQHQKLEVVLNEALNKWNDCLEGYANWPFDDITVKIVGWSVLDRNCLQDIHAMVTAKLMPLSLLLPQKPETRTGGRVQVHSVTRITVWMVLASVTLSLVMHRLRVQITM